MPIKVDVGPIRIRVDGTASNTELRRMEWTLPPGFTASPNVPQLSRLQQIIEYLKALYR